MVYPRGKTLGGSSSINGMLYIEVSLMILITGDSLVMLVGLGKMFFHILKNLKISNLVKMNFMDLEVPLAVQK